MENLSDFGISQDRIRDLIRPDWYLTLYPDVAADGTDALNHYWLFGWREERSPSPLFVPHMYLRLNGPKSDVPTIVDYLTNPGDINRDPHPAFSTKWYCHERAQNVSDRTALEHYLSEGSRATSDPHPLFSTAWYLERNADHDLGELTPLEHYLTVGWRRGNSPCAMFNPAVYRSVHHDLDEDNEPLTHYLLFGQGEPERRFVNPFFDEHFYETQFSDKSDISWGGNLADFIRVGHGNGRRSSADPRAALIAEYLVTRQSRSTRFLVSMSSGTQAVVMDWDRRAAELELQTSDEPVVSIIIPTFDHSEDVIRCLESIADLPDSTPHEIVVVDDGSSARHSQRLALIRGIKLCVLKTNVGFADATTAGIKESQGEMIVLLNNDTEVLPGWLDALVRTLCRGDDIGLVGSMIIHPDFRLQEAGCVVFRDGDARQLGCREWPTDWRYQVSRDVDYCSGASLIFRRTFWEEAGGFDPRFAPAYYEDTDLAITARSKGFRVVYQPESMLFHNEGTSHGRTFTGIKQMQLRNKTLFFEKWKDWLSNKPETPEKWSFDDEWRTRDQSSDKIVVVIDHQVPQANHDAGSIRMVNIITLLRELGYRVTFVPENGVLPQPSTSVLTSMDVEVFGLHYRHAAFDSYLRELSGRIVCVVASRPDTALAVFSSVTQSLPMVPFIYDMVDAHGLRKRNEARITGLAEDVREAERFESIERKLARVSDVVVAVSESDENEFRRLAGTNIEMVRLATIHRPVGTSPDFDERFGLLFVGGYGHSPNVDAVTYFVHEVLPLVRQEVGPIRVVLAGSNPPKEVLALEGTDVVVPGWVEDLSDFYRFSRLVIAPLRFGAGVKGKIGEAMAHGVPVISTSVGISGMYLSHGDNVLIGDTKEEFARQVIDLYGDADTWRRIRSRALETVEERFGWEHSRRQVQLLLNLVRKV